MRIDGILQGLSRIIYALGLALGFSVYFLWPRLLIASDAVAANCTATNATLAGQSMMLLSFSVRFPTRAELTDVLLNVAGCHDVDGCLEMLGLAIGDTFVCSVGSDLQVPLLPVRPALSWNVLLCIVCLSSATCVPCCLIGGTPAIAPRNYCILMRCSQLVKESSAKLAKAGLTASVRGYAQACGKH